MDHELRTLTALPVHNEVNHVTEVLDQAVRYSQTVLVVDDGSRDGTSDLLAARTDIQVVRHLQNQGYGAALRSAFQYAIRQGYDVLVTIDCDGQHEPALIPCFVETAREADIVSGSRYLSTSSGQSRPPEDRRRINQTLTEEINRRLGLKLTDAFCGFKAYRTSALTRLRTNDPGYAMPLELWVRAAELGLKVVELPVPLVYLEEHRSFGGSLDDAQRRLAVYREVLDRAIEQTGVFSHRRSCAEKSSTAVCLPHSPQDCA